MNEDQVKREIEDALSVEPSPQFMSRVRREIAAEPRPRVRLPWTLLTAGLVSAAVMVGVFVFQSRQSKNLSPQALETPIPRRVPVINVPQPQNVEKIAANKPALKIVPKATPAASPQSAEPEVLFDPREAAAFRSFVDAVQAKKINASRLDALFEAVERADSTIEPMPIAGAPIEIRPLKSAAEEKPAEGETL